MPFASSQSATQATRRSFLLGSAASVVLAVPKPSRAAALASYSAPPSVAPEPKPPTSEDEDLNPYIRGLLRKTEPLREQRKKERLAAFNKKIFSDGYFDYETRTSGAMRGVKPETREAIERWMRENEVK